ncbi:MAG: hypothetical protein SFX18_14085 [Pirellulales bacterium]|nr:hypothetical protein [Pirellulales bacterium]
MSNQILRSLTWTSVCLIALAGTVNLSSTQVVQRDGALPTIQVASQGGIAPSKDVLSSKFGDLQAKYGDLQTKNGDLHTKWGDLHTKIGDLYSKMGDLSADFPY